MAAHAGDLIKVVALLMQAGKKNRLWRHRLTLRVIFMEAVNVNAEPGKDGVTGGWGQLVRRDRGLDLSCQHGMDMSQMSQRRKVKKVKKMKSDFDFWLFLNPPPSQPALHTPPRQQPSPRRPACVATRGNPGTDWSCRSIMLSRHRPPICPAIEIYFSMNADGMDRHSAARHSSPPSMERRYRVTLRELNSSED